MTSNDRSDTGRKKVEHLTQDRLLELLSNSRRRHMVRAICDPGGASIGDVTDAVAEKELEKPSEEISTNERHKVYVSLKQTHSDVLEQAGVIDYYDQGYGGYYTPGPNADMMVRWLDFLDEERGEREVSPQTPASSVWSKVTGALRSSD